MKDNSLLNELIKFSNITTRERVLVIDDSWYLCNKLEKIKMELNTSYCNPEDFRSITNYPDIHLNAFDLVICPECIYNLPIDNYQLLLQCIVWSMSPSSRLIFSIPDINKFSCDNNFKINDIESYIKEYKNIFAIKSPSWLFDKTVEKWNKLPIVYPTQIFKVWNSFNPNSQWNLNNIAIKNHSNFLLYSLEMRKQTM